MNRKSQIANLLTRATETQARQVHTVITEKGLFFFIDGKEINGKVAAATMAAEKEKHKVQQSNFEVLNRIFSARRLPVTDGFRTEIEPALTEWPDYLRKRFNSVINKLNEAAK